MNMPIHITEEGEEIARLRTQLAEAQARILHLESICAAYLPPNIHLTDYSALSEALAQECERLSDKLKTYPDDIGITQMTAKWLREEAAAHRGGQQ